MKVRHGLLAVLLGAELISLSLGAASPAHAQDVDCSDFASQAAAQDWYEAHGGPAQDPADLDRDNDGIAQFISTHPTRSRAVAASSQ